jgi:hypothetical protein
VDQAWIGRWRDDLRADVRRLLSGFESRFGFPSDEHEVSGPLFALAAGSGAPVLRLADGALLDGAYDAGCALPVARDLQAVLDLLRRETAGFVRF